MKSFYPDYHIKEQNIHLYTGCRFRAESTGKIYTVTDITAHHIYYKEDGKNYIFSYPVNTTTGNWSKITVL